MHDNCEHLYRKYAAPLIELGMRVLEIGPDCIPTTLQVISQRPGITWHVLGIDGGKELDVHARSEYEYPIPDGAYDVVVAANVLEHVRKPWVWIRELARVTRSGGYVVTVNPVSWPYHEAPIDCWRAYPEGMRALYDEANLEVRVCRCEATTPIHSTQDTPGRSISAYGWKHRLVDSFLGRIGYPQERAYDTITVGARRLQS